MKTKVCKVAVFDCKTGKMRIEEREMPVYEPPKLQPSQIETVLYHLCKLMDPPDNVLDEFVKHYESTFGKTYKPPVKFVTDSELSQKLGDLTQLSSEVSIVPVKGSKTGQLSTGYANTLSFSMLSIPAGILSVDISANLQMPVPKGKACGCEIMLSGNTIANIRVVNTAKTFKISGKFAVIKDSALTFKFIEPPRDWVNWTVKYDVSVSCKVLTVG